MSSTQVVRDIFELNKKERVFDDFSCAYKHSILLHGRLYLTENYVCFYSNLLGIKHKLKLELKKIKEIKKKNTLGLLANALKITTEDGQAYKFTSFSKRNVAYKSFVALWKNVSSYAKEAILEEDEPSEVDDSEPEIIETKEEVKGTLAYSNMLINNYLVIVDTDPPSGAVGRSVISVNDTSIDAKYEEPRTSLLKAKAKSELPCVPTTKFSKDSKKDDLTSTFSKNHVPRFGENRVSIILVLPNFHLLLYLTLI